MSSVENVSMSGSALEGRSLEPSSTPPSNSASDAPITPRQLSEAEQTAAIAKLLSEGGDDESAIGNPTEDRPEPGVEAQDQRPAADSDREGVGQPEPDTEGEPAGAGDEQGAGDEDSAAADSDDGPGTLSDIAEKLDMTPDQLYSLEIPTRDGEAITLGDLKDAWQDRQSAAHENARKAEQLNERENAILLDQQMLAQIQHEMGQHLSPQTKERMRIRSDQQAQFQRQQMLQQIPEFADESVFQNWREGAIKFMGEYGYQPHELVITDHRMVRVLRDLMAKSERLDKLLSFDPEKELKRKPPKSARPKGRAVARKNKAQDIVDAARRGEIDPDQAVAHLLNGG